MTRDVDADDEGAGVAPQGVDDHEARPPPEDSFATVGNEIRLEILRVLHERLSVGDRSEYTVPYSELREAVGVEDSGKFGYHLNRLLGEFVEKREDGYAIRHAGKELVRTVESGAVGRSEGGESGPTDAACFCCGAPVTVSYLDGYVSALCTECDGALGFDFMPDGALSSIPLPTGAVGDAVEIDPRGLLDRAHGRFCHRVRVFGDGICPRCGGRADAEFRVCPDHDTSDGLCPACGIVLPATIEVTCTVCSEGGVVPPACLVSHREPFHSLLADDGSTRLGYETFAMMAGLPFTVVDYEGETALEYDLPNVDGPVVLDAALDIHVES